MRYKTLAGALATENLRQLPSFSPHKKDPACSHKLKSSNEDN